MGGKPNPELFIQLKSIVNFDLPLDYIELISTIDGLDGDIGEKCIRFWNIDEILLADELYKLEDFKFHEKYFVFASNSGIFNYVFLRENSEIVELDMFDDAYCRYFGKSITEFLYKLSLERL